jgi:hypothetical protein
MGQKQKAFIPQNGERRHSTNSAKKTAWRTGPILLFAEKRPETFGADERNQTGILTRGFVPSSRLPARGQWHWEL